MESIRQLSYPHIEWIVVDGGSTDGTVDLLRQVRTDYCGFIWISEKDSGIYDAWNKAIRMSHGEWVAFLGAGDTINSDTYDIYFRAIVKQARVPDLVSSKMRLVDQSGRVVRVKGEAFQWANFRKKMTVAHPGALHHRSLFDRYGLFDITFASAGDYEFLMRCGQDIKAIYLDFISVNMLVGGTSDGYRGLAETFHIQCKYGVNPLAAKYRHCLASAKRYMRPFFRGY